MDNNNIDFSSDDIKKAPDLITRVKDTTTLKDRLKALIKKRNKSLKIIGIILAAAVLIATAVIIIITVTRPAPTPPTTNGEVLGLVDEVNALEPDLSDPETAEDEKNTIIDDINQKAENTETVDDKMILNTVRSATLFKYGDYAGAIANQLEIVAVLETDKEYEKLVESYGFIADCYAAMGDTASAISSYERALSYFPLAVSESRPITMVDQGYYESKLSVLKGQ